MKNLRGVLFAFLALVSCNTPTETTLAPVTSQYIVRLAHRSDVRDVSREFGLYPRRSFLRAMYGFSATLTDAQVSALRADSRVLSVERDGAVRLTRPRATPLFVQSPVPSWGLDRIDQRSLPFDNTFGYDRTGSGVHIYFIDSGIRSTHVDFVGRIASGVDLVGDGNGTEDCNGHGTHVAGTAGGTAYGVAKSATLVPIRVFDCAGDTIPKSTVIAALDTIIAIGVKPAVINMSLGGSFDTTENSAVAAATSAGFTVVVAAGNERVDACTESPGSTPSALTVGSTTVSDRMNTDSNFGSCVDFYAPGAGIWSDWITSDTATMQLSGTSMAAAHASGVAALYLEGRATASAQEVSDSLKAYSTKGIVLNTGSSNCNLLYSYRVVFTGHVPKCK